MCGCFSIKLILHDRLDALEAVLPRHHQAHRRAVLIGQRLAVQADGQDGRADASPHPGAGLRRRARRGWNRPRWPGISAGRPASRTRRYLALAVGSTRLSSVRQREADPRDHHRPAFHAAHAVDALLERRRLDEIVEVVVPPALPTRPSTLTVQGLVLQGVRVLGGIALVGAEFVEVVVAGDVLEGRGWLVGGGEWALGRLQRCSLRAHPWKRYGQARAEPQCGRAGDELPAAQIHLARSNLGWGDVGGAPN